MCGVHMYVCPHAHGVPRLMLGIIPNGSSTPFIKEGSLNQAQGLPND